MRRLILSTALAAALVAPIPQHAGAQPAKGAPAALERARETMSNRFRDTKLTGDPDRDFAELLIASYEETLFLAKTQLDYGGDRQRRATRPRVSRKRPPRRRRPRSRLRRRRRRTPRSSPEPSRRSTTPRAR